MALASLRPLRSRNFALIWSAALVSNIGTWMQTVALGILVFARTGQPAWTGLVAAAGFIPIGLLAPLGGALADRFDRRRWLIATTVAEMSFAAMLAVLAAGGDDRPAVLVLFSFLGGASGAIGFPAYQAMVPDLVPHDDLLGAVSLSSAQFNLGRVIGPALAGLALLTHDYAVVFGINAASFGAVVVALVMVRLPKPLNAGSALGIVPRIVVGARAAVAEPGCRAAIELISVVALLASPFIALVPAMSAVVHRHGVSIPVATALLVTAQGIGAVAGALVLPSLAERFGRRTVLRAGAVRPPAAAGGVRPGPDPLVVAGGVHGRRRRLHRRPVRSQHRGAGARPGRSQGPRARHLHGGPGHRLPGRRRPAGVDRRPHRGAGGHRGGCRGPARW